MPKNEVNQQSSSKMIKVRLAEKLNPRYVYFSPGNRLHVLGPLTSGGSISLDNTCKTLLALQEFFGKRADSENVKNSARHELLRLKEQLEADIAVLTEDNEKIKRQERLEQAVNYIDFLEELELHPSMSKLTGPHPCYPAPVLELLNRKYSNVYAMKLAPMYPDIVSRVHNAVFSLYKNNYGESFCKALHDIHIEKLANNHKRRVKEKIKELFLETAYPIKVCEAIKLICPSIPNYYLELFPHKEFPEFKDDDIDLKIYGYDDKPNLNKLKSLEKLIDTILNQYTTKEQVTRLICMNDASIFNLLVEPVEKEKLSIMVQFFLAQVNIYLYSLELSQLSLEDEEAVIETNNFGIIFDDNYHLAQKLAGTVKNALENGLSVEDALCTFINDHCSIFGLKMPLSPLQISAIKKRCSEDYVAIKDSPHFDEFFLIEPTGASRGHWFAHQNGFCFNLIDLLTTEDLKDLKFPNKEKVLSEVSEIPGNVPNREISDIGFFCLDFEDFVISLKKAICEKNLTEVCKILLEMEDGRYLFEELSDAFFDEIRADNEARILLYEVRKDITDAKIRNSYNKIVLGKNAQLLLLPEMARSLYVAVADEISLSSERVNDYTTVESIQAFLADLKFPNLDVIKSYNGAFIIDTDEKTKDALEKIIAKYTNSFHLTNNMAASLYKQVEVLYKSDHPQYQFMNRLNNKELPYKLNAALGLLHIDTTGVTLDYPNKGMDLNGYIFKNLKPDTIRIFEEIHQSFKNRITLTLENCEVMYQCIYYKGLRAHKQHLSGLTSQGNAYKVKTALVLLKIAYLHVEIEENGNFLIYLNPAEQAKLKYIVGIDLNEEERKFVKNYKIEILTTIHFSTNAVINNTQAQIERDYQQFISAQVTREDYQVNTSAGTPYQGPTFFMSDDSLLHRLNSFNNRVPVKMYYGPQNRGQISYPYEIALWRKFNELLLNRSHNEMTKANFNKKTGNQIRFGKHYYRLGSGAVIEYKGFDNNSFQKQAHDSWAIDFKDNGTVSVLKFGTNSLTEIHGEDKLIAFKIYCYDLKLDINTEITITRDRNFKTVEKPDSIRFHQGEIFCPKHILMAFRELISKTAILGVKYCNYYKNEEAYFPKVIEQLTPHHLHILANNASDKELWRYNNLLTRNQLATLKVLFKATIAMGISYRGPTENSAVPLEEPVPLLIIEQPAFQWGDNIQDSGGMFFYPLTAQYPKHYREWQDNSFQGFFNSIRPETYSKNHSLFVKWINIEGFLDLDLIAKAYEIEYLQQFEAVAQHRLAPNLRVLFRYSRADLGLTKLSLDPQEKKIFSSARLKGILSALIKIKNLPLAQRIKAIGNIDSLELSFTEYDDQTLLLNIQEVIKQIGFSKQQINKINFSFIRFSRVDSTPLNNKKPLTLVVTQGSDEKLPPKTYVDYLIAAYNEHMQITITPDFSNTPTTDEFAFISDEDITNESAWYEKKLLEKMELLRKKYGYDEAWKIYDSAARVLYVFEPNTGALLFRKNESDIILQQTGALVRPINDNYLILGQDRLNILRDLCVSLNLQLPPLISEKTNTFPELEKEIPEVNKEPLYKNADDSVQKHPVFFAPTGVSQQQAEQQIHPGLESMLNNSEPDFKNDTIDIILKLICNITKKTNGRCTWFNTNVAMKVNKLQDVISSLQKPGVIPNEQTLSEIRSICSIKRNHFGLFSPHSLIEFNTLIREKNLESKLQMA